MSRVLDSWEKTVVHAASRASCAGLRLTPETVAAHIPDLFTSDPRPSTILARVAATLPVLRALRQLPTERSPLRVVP